MKKLIIKTTQSITTKAQPLVQQKFLFQSNNSCILSDTKNAKSVMSNLHKKQKSDFIVPILSSESL